MKNNLKTLTTTILSSLFLFVISSCGPDPVDEPSPEQQQLEKLTYTWTVNSVTFGGSEDRSADWSGFSLTISTSQGYSTSNAFSPGPWPSSGTWSFAGSGDAVNINQVVRNDGMEISISVTETTLTMTFIYDDTQNTGGRTEQVNGEYVFVMSR